MNKRSMTILSRKPTVPNFKKLATLTATMLLMAACASAPSVPQDVVAVRARLTTLRTNPELASRAPVEIQAAEVAVTAAEVPQKDADVTRHLVLIANQKVEVAGAWAQSRQYEDQRATLSATSESMRLDARTLEADRARLEADAARNQTDAARDQANTARNQANAARSDANVARTDASNA